MIWKFKQWLCHRIFVFWWNSFLPVGGCTICGNRYERVFSIRHCEFRIIHRDTTKPDAYSREELLRMQRLIREHEFKMRWKVPDEYTERLIRERMDFGRQVLQLEREVAHYRQLYADEKKISVDALNTTPTHTVCIAPIKEPDGKV